MVYKERSTSLYQQQFISARAAGAALSASALHLPAEEAGRHLRELRLCLAGGGAALGLEHDDGAGHVALRNDRAHNRGRAAHALHGAQMRAAAADEAVPPLHIFLELRGNAPLKVFPSRHARRRHDVVAVADERRQVCRFAQHLRILGGKRGKLSYRRVFPENHASLRVGENFQRIALADPQRAADLLRDDHAAEVVCTCQVFAKIFFEGRKTA